MKVKVAKIQIAGKLYYKTVHNILYDPQSEDQHLPIGIYDPETKTIKPLPQEDEEDEEEEEEQYDSDSSSSN